MSVVTDVGHRCLEPYIDRPNDGNTNCSKRFSCLTSSANKTIAHGHSCTRYYTHLCHTLHRLQPSRDGGLGALTNGATTSHGHCLTPTGHTCTDRNTTEECVHRLGREHRCPVLLYLLGGVLSFTFESNLYTRSTIVGRCVLQCRLLASLAKPVTAPVTGAKSHFQSGYIPHASVAALH